MKIKNLLLGLLIMISMSCKKDLSNEIINHTSTRNAKSLMKASEKLQNKSMAYIQSLPTSNPTTSGTVPLYRLFNPFTSRHHYAVYSEAIVLINTLHDPGVGITEWVSEGIAGYVFTTSNPVGLYRHFRSSTRDHYISSSSTPPANYTYEGVLGYIGSVKAVNNKAFYSYFKNSGQFDRLYTSNPSELNGNSSWTTEGIIGYIY